MGDWLLRDASEADAETLAAVIRTAFAEYRGRLDPPSGALAETADSVSVASRSTRTTSSCVVGDRPFGMPVLAEPRSTPSVRSSSR